MSIEIPTPPEVEAEARPEPHPMPKTYRQLLKKSPEQLRDLTRILVDRTVKGEEGRTCDKLYDYFSRIFPAAVQVASHQPKSDSAQLLMAELAVVFKFITTVRSTYGLTLRSPESQNQLEHGTLPFLRIDRAMAVDPLLLQRIESVAKANAGSWLAWCRKEAVLEMAEEDPVKLIGDINDLRELLDEVRLNIKLDDHQLKLLRAFFRDA